MSTNLGLDQELLDRAFGLSGEATAKTTITRSLQQFIARREQRRVAELLASSNGMLGLITRPNGLASRESAGGYEPWVPGLAPCC